MTKIKIELSAFRGEELVKTIESDSIKTLNTVFDGYKINQLAVAVILTSKQDVEDLMHLLNIHQNCFPSNDTSSVKINLPNY